MAGGLLQLIAKGAQDHNLVGNPQISFFKVVYRRYTNFSMETIKLDIEGSNISSSGKTLLNIPIKRNADMVSNMYYTFELPHIYSGSDDSNIPYEFKWVENIGSNIIDNVRLLIGSSEIDNHTGQYLNVRSELKFNETEKKAYKELIGHVPELYEPKINLNESIFIPVLTGTTKLTDNINADNLYDVYYKPFLQSDGNLTIYDNIGNNTITFATDTALNNLTDDFFVGYYVIIGEEETGETTAIANNTVTIHSYSKGTGNQDFYIGYDIVIGNQRRKITDSDNSAAPVLTVDSNWTTNPAAGSNYRLIPPKRKIISYNATTRVCTLESVWSQNPTTATNDAKVFLVKGDGSGMKVSIEKDSSNNITSIDIVEKGETYRDHDELFIDLSHKGPKPTFTNNNSFEFTLLKSDYPHVRDNLTTRHFDEHSKQLYKSVSKISSIQKSNRFKLIPSIQGRKIKVPLQFFFNSNKGLALPLISLQGADVNIEMNLKKSKDLFTILRKNEDTTSNPTLTSFNREFPTNVNINTFLNVDTFNINSGFEANYIFLDTEERKRFAEHNQDYLIEEVQLVKLEEKSATETYDILLNHPVKELIIIPQRTDMKTINNWNNYTNWANEHIPPYSHDYLENQKHYRNNNTNSQVFYNKKINNQFQTDTFRNFDNKFFRKNIISKIELLFNGQVRQRINDNIFYNKIQTYQHHKTCPKDGIYVYSFSLNPNEFQPSGACNFSRISNFQIKFDLGLQDQIFTLPDNYVDTTTTSGKQFTYNYNIYAVSYNILKIASGNGAKQYVN